MLSHLRNTARLLAGGDWPGISLLQQMLDQAGVCTASGIPLRLAHNVSAGDEPYEIRLYSRGELEFRERNWHDLFNVLIWLTFPRAKAQLNARHYGAFANVPAAPGGRGPVRDALTLFDEDGLIVLSAHPGLLQMIRNFEWKPLFWERRSETRAGTLFLPFGHAMCEKALAPYRGMTGRSLLVQVESAYFDLSPTEQIKMADGRVAQLLADAGALQGTRDLAPVPVLGIPGWCADNECAEYYDDSRYFRPGRSERPLGGSAATGTAMKGRG